MIVSVSVKDKALAYLAELGSTYKREITDGLKHLDLAGTGQYPRFRPFECLDLAGTITSTGCFKAFIIVRFGARRFINRSVLKSFGNGDSLTLFPNFPLEVRCNIYDHAVARPESVGINVTDNGSGGWSSSAGGYPNYNLMAANTEAFNYLTKEYGYAPIFKDGTTLFSPKVDGMINLTISATAPNPMLKISRMFSKGFDLANIGSFVFEISDLENGNPAQWIMDNLLGMPNLTSLTIRCQLKTSAVEQSEVKFDVVSEAWDGRDERYIHALVTDEGLEYKEDFELMTKIGVLGVKDTEIQGVMDLFMMLDRSLLNTNRFPSFPDMVRISFQWIL